MKIVPGESSIFSSSSWSCMLRIRRFSTREHWSHLHRAKGHSHWNFWALIWVNFEGSAWSLLYFQEKMTALFKRRSSSVTLHPMTFSVFKIAAILHISNLMILSWLCPSVIQTPLAIVHLLRLRHDDWGFRSRDDGSHRHCRRRVVHWRSIVQHPRFWSQERWDDGREGRGDCEFRRLNL